MTAESRSLSIISAIGNSNLQAGDTLTATFGSGLGSWSISLAEEATDDDGFVYWKDIFSWSSVSVSGDDVVIDYVVPDIAEINTPNSRQFFRFKYNTACDYPINLKITTENEKLARAFVDEKAIMLSPHISRTADFTVDETKNASLYIQKTGSYFTSLVNGGGGSHLKWHKTNDPNWLSTLFYARNHTEKGSGSEISLEMSIQALVQTTDRGAQWRSPTIDDTRINYFNYYIYTIDGEQTHPIEFIVRNYGTDEHPYCKVWNGDEYVNVGFSALFWRINNTAINFSILEEELESDLPESIPYDNFIEIFANGSHPDAKTTIIKQAINKTPT